MILLSHNPDFAETLHDPRVGLILSGHTHGGQVVFARLRRPDRPLPLRPEIPPRPGPGPRSQVFVSRGVGTVTPPVRFFCRPEVVLITLV